MLIKITKDYSPYSKGEERDVDESQASVLIGCGIAVKVEAPVEDKKKKTHKKK